MVVVVVLLGVSASHDISHDGSGVSKEQLSGYLGFVSCVKTQCI